MNICQDKAKDIFLSAVDAASLAERCAYLDGACADDDALRRDVEELLRHYEGLGAFLQSGAMLAAAEQDIPALGEGPGTMVGPYKLLEQIGEGGMGLVFMAEQLRPVRRRVALKILKPGLDTRQVVARFEAERQALAMMDHANIAKVFDAGMTDTGRPYFVMELVHGVPITTYCDQHRLTPRQRLELFIKVCQAVQHAHQKGIIHRDLKPSNVLVSLHDTVPVPKIIDFGIAKATGEQLTEKTLFTHFSQIVGTPLYMSPEQAEMNGLGIDTRSDVYALGVMLYELLTGATPFDSETLKKVGYDEMRRIIREEEPPRPSDRVSTLEAAACTTVSARRGMDERPLAPLLRGELDWIVMKALEKDRNRRYESASALAADVQRYLQDEAVEACPPSAGYKVRKFVRRNRRLVGMVGVIVLVLLAATAVSAWQAFEAIAARRLADERSEKEKLARQDAAQEAAVAKAVNDFLQVDLLRLADRQVQIEEGFVADSNLTVREALHRAAAKIGVRFKDQPLVEAPIRTTIGQAYLGLGESKLAVTHLEQALSLYKGELGPDHPIVLTAMDKLAVAYAMAWCWDRSKSIAVYEQVVEKRKATLGPDHPDTIESMARLGRAYGDGGRFVEGILLCKQVLEKRQATLGPDHPLTINSMRDLASSYRHAGQWEIAVPLVESMYEKAKARHDHNHPDTRPSLLQVAMAYELVGRLDEALALYEKTLEISKAMNDPDNFNVSSVNMFYARACHKVGKLERAEHLLREMLETIGKRDGSFGSQQAADVLQYLALNLMMQKRYGEAEPYARQALATFEKTQPDSWWPFHAMNLVGSALSGQGKYTDAEPLLVKGYEGLKQREATIYAPQKKRVTESLERVIQFYEATNQLVKAREWREKLANEKAHH